MFYLTLHISHRTLNIKWCTCVWDNVGTWHLQEVDPLNSGEEENKNKNWHFFLYQVTFSLDSVPSFHFFIFVSFLVTDEVIFKQQGVEPELGLTFLQPLLVHRRCLLAQINMVCCLFTSTAECFLFRDVQHLWSQFVLIQWSSCFHQFCFSPTVSFHDFQ